LGEPTTVESAPRWTDHPAKEEWGRFNRTSENGLHRRWDRIYDRSLPRWSPLLRGRTLRDSNDRKVPGRKARKREGTTSVSLVGNELDGVAGNRSIGRFRNPACDPHARRTSRRRRVTMDTNILKRLLGLAAAQGRPGGDLNRGDRNAIRREEPRLRPPFRRRQKSGVRRPAGARDSARARRYLHYRGHLCGEAEAIFRPALIVEMPAGA